jgi:hypothetical protein
MGQAVYTAPKDALDKIKDEGWNRSQVMQTLSFMTDVIGPRLTGSPNMKRANEWTRDTMTKWGMQNAHLESWGPFGRGDRSSVHFGHLVSARVVSGDERYGHKRGRVSRCENA